ncbi:F0F1 ATP synthase subunit A [Lachnospiraceae bacterium ZAX-1]
MDNAILMSAGADVDFMVHGLFSYRLFGIGPEVWITTTHVCVLIVMLILIGFSIVANRKIKQADEQPGAFQNIVELIVEMLDNMVRTSMGKNSSKFVNYISTIFIFILVCNISGLFGLRPPTADYGVTLPLGLITFSLIHFNKFKHQKPIGVIKGLMDPWPIWIPINIIGDLAVPISLSLRLFANILSGTVMMALVYGLLSKIAYFWPGVLHIYFDCFSGAIQTYVFCMLTMTFVTDAIGES